MSTQEQLDWEARWAKPAAMAAFGTVALLIAGTIVRQAVALADRPDDERGFLVAIDENAGAFLASSVIQALSFLTLIGVFLYLGRAVLARRPELPGILLWLGAIGPALLAVASILSDLNRLDIADEFLASGAQTVERAESLLDDGNVAAAALGSAGTLGLAIAFVFIGINAMRVGLLTRFMGIVGAVIGVLYVIPILAGPLVVQLFWLIALGVLFLGHWPGGLGPAWQTGEAIEWPSGVSRQREELQQEAAGEQPALDEPPPGDGANGTNGAAAPRPSRKRKRR
ncbi:MAG: hypothetical protein WD993_00060 [Thermoleophilaceae bacterium]